MRTFSLKKAGLCLMVMAGLATMTAPAANAQDVTTGSATATILAVLSVTATQALNFGNVYQGVAKTQDETSDANSGIFTITGAAAANISCYFQLPEFVALANGSDRMTITFSSTDATFSVLDAAAPSTPSAPGLGATLNTNPRNLTGTAIGAGGTSQIFLGGKVIPSVNQTAGAYSADIVLTVAYLGT
ncbi:MAG: hypothetical protein HY851_11610 [candidate division Zixibacteria bacterium]|nr:hypothetical protein [candidate division Zixibacteria bacterium]